LATVSKNRLRILFVSDHFGHAEGVIHGATRYFLTTLPRLAQRNIELHVAFLRDKHPAAKQIEDQGVTPTFFGRSKWSPRTIMDIRGLVKEKHIDVIHCAGMKAILSSRVAGKLTGTPVIAHLHDCEPIPQSMSRLMKWTDGLAGHTLAVSAEVAQHGSETLGLALERSEVLPNGLTVAEMRSVPDEAGVSFRHAHGLLPEARVIAVIGRLAAVKGQEILLRAMPAILADEPNARLVVIGDGPDRAKLKQRTTELGLDGYVTFTGQIQDVYSALRAIDVVAMPSQREGLPYTLLESMAMGVPVVASSVGGLAEVIQHCENGVLVRPGDAQALAEAINSVLSDELLTETVTQGGLELIKTYDIDHHIDRLLALYRALAVGKPIPPASTPRTVAPASAMAQDPVAEHSTTL